MFFSKKSYEFIVYKRYIYLKNILKISLKNKSGRSNKGRLILLGRGGGYKRYYRLIDFKRILYNIPAKVINFEYDPNRSVFIMLILYKNGILSYILAPNMVKLHTFILSGKNILPFYGNSTSLLKCPTGSFIHCVKLGTLKSIYARSAGTYIQLIRKLGPFVLLRMPSKEELFVFGSNFCTLGRLSGDVFKLIKKSSAGYKRRLGFKSKVRGVAKNPVDHPHGGGEGRTTAGQPSVTPWGFYTKGHRTSTRFNRKNFNKWGFFKRRNGKLW